MTTEFTEENWNRMAEAYEAFTTGEDSYSGCIEWPCVRQMLPEIKDKRALDLGCGTGHFTFLLEEYNPRKLVGVDLSPAMLNIAKKKAAEKRSAAQFVCMDACAYRPEEAFDLIFSSTLTHYIQDLDGFFQHIGDMLAPGGTCVLSVMHPVYSAQYPARHDDGSLPGDEEWVVRYLDPSERAYVQPWIEFNDDIPDFLSQSYHHTFSAYLNAGIRGGLTLSETREPLPPPEWERQYPGRYQAFVETPSFLIMRWTKA